MPSTVTLIACLALSTLALPATAQATKTLLQGKEAADEIAAFMTTRWDHQTWRIESRPTDSNSQRSAWYIAGTGYRVRLDGPQDQKDRNDLAKLDPTAAYEITGVPVDHNYSAITFYLLSPPEKVAAETTEQADPSPAKPAEELSAKDALCLAEACRITALINEEKWDEVEKALGDKKGMVAILKLNSTPKDWPGIGAYRGFRIDKESPRQVTFRFGFAPKSHPHEIWISFTEGDPAKPGLTVLGW